jgi:hypothetical protein
MDPMRLEALDTRDDKRVVIDIERPMLGPNGQPDSEFFVADGLHLSPRGYAIWRNRGRDAVSETVRLTPGVDDR